MSKLDGKFCEWCDEPAKRSYPLRGSKTFRVYACDEHSKVAYRHAYRSASAADGSLTDELEAQQR